MAQDAPKQAGRSARPAQTKPHEARPMRREYSLRARFAVGTLLLLCVITELYLLLSLFQSPPGFDPVTWNERRMDAVRRALPQHGLIGYLGEKQRAAVHVSGNYYLTQYALAPLVLDFNSTLPTIVLVNNAEDQTLRAVDSGLELKTDFGNGVKMFHHPPKR